ncbi:exodeoxyribonuclease VII large subunit [Roseivirga sp. BDSF3-8]|uniref:exodeoxyribonuclease VII large subunit n=1 Tax=Roseivirga sp. BDSF3-8 TaxID=3241598 RepID=UPI003532080D
MESRLTLFELNRLIRNTLDANLEPGYWVVAEIGEMRMNQRGHCYMELVEKEDDQVKAKIRANIWAYTYRNISGWFEAVTGQGLEPGMKVLAFGKVQFHELYGMSLNIQDIDPQFTLGERARRKQEILKLLKEEGVYDMNRQLPLPLVPQRLAVISSPTAAGFGDFVHQLENNRNGYHFEIVLFQALMQGDKAPAAIVNAMHQIYEQMDCFDALIIIRGGGSQVDLDCFDTYEVASHVAQFPLPVFTGIGHERDETIADMVAHTSLKTPTAVAEFLLSGATRFDDRLNTALRSLIHVAAGNLSRASRLTDQLSGRLHMSVQQRLHNESVKLEVAGRDIRNQASNYLNREENRLEEMAKALKKLPEARLRSEKDKLVYLEKSLNLQHPDRLLEKGYTLTLNKGKIVKSAADLKPGDTLETRGRDFVLSSTLDKIEDGKA